MRIDRLKIFLDSMGGGAWPFLVGGVICLVNSVNERDLSLLISLSYPLPSLPSAEIVVWLPSWESGSINAGGLPESAYRIGYVSTRRT